MEHFCSLDASSCTMWATISIIQMGDIFAITELQPSMNLAAILQNLHCHSNKDDLFAREQNLTKEGLKCPQ